MTNKDIKKDLYIALYKALSLIKSEDWHKLEFFVEKEIPKFGFPIEVQDALQSTLTLAVEGERIPERVWNWFNNYIGSFEEEVKFIGRSSQGVFIQDLPLFPSLLGGTFEYSLRPSLTEVKAWTKEALKK